MFKKVVIYGSLFTFCGIFSQNTLFSRFHRFSIQSNSTISPSYLYPNGNVSLGQIDYNNYINGLLTVDEIYEGALYA